MLSYIGGFAIFGLGVYWLFERTWWQDIIIIVLAPLAMTIPFGIVMMLVMGTLKLVDRRG